MYGGSLVDKQHYSGLVSWFLKARLTMAPNRIPIRVIDTDFALDSSQKRILDASMRKLTEFEDRFSEQAKQAHAQNQSEAFFRDFKEAVPGILAQYALILGLKPHFSRQTFKDFKSGMQDAYNALRIEPLQWGYFAKSFGFWAARYKADSDKWSSDGEWDGVARYNFWVTRIPLDGSPMVESEHMAEGIRYKGDSLDRVEEMSKNDRNAAYSASSNPMHPRSRFDGVYSMNGHHFYRGRGVSQDTVMRLLEAGKMRELRQGQPRQGRYRVDTYHIKNRKWIQGDRRALIAEKGDGYYDDLKVAESSARRLGLNLKTMVRIVDTGTNKVLRYNLTDLEIPEPEVPEFLALPAEFPHRSTLIDSKKYRRL